MQTVLKFFANDDIRRGNKYSSATLGKIAVIDRIWLDDNQHVMSTIAGNFWLCDIVRETEHGKARGCFIVHPIRCLKREPSTDWPGKLTPGFYNEALCNGMLLITPKLEFRDFYWIVPLALKHKWRERNPNIYAIVVDQFGSGIDFIDPGSLLPPPRFMPGIAATAQATRPYKSLRILSTRTTVKPLEPPQEPVRMDQSSAQIETTLPAPSVGEIVRSTPMQ